MPRVNRKQLVGEVKKKYQITDNSFVFKPKDDVRDLLEVEIGDTKQPNDFYPQIKAKRWNNEANASFRLVHDEASPAVEAIDDKIKFVGKDLEVHFYDKPADEDNEDGAYEFEVLLKSKPKTNVLKFTIQSKGVVFYYQPAYNAIFKDGYSQLFKKEIVVTELQIRDANTGKVMWDQPEHVLGSYAVYLAENKPTFVGKTEYKCGKLGHIYRPLVTDAAGKKVWGNLRINEAPGELSIVIPQDFLEKAVYPVLVDPTFGWTSTGSATNYPGLNNLIGDKGTVGATGGNVDDVKMYNLGSPSNVKAVITTDAKSILANGVSPSGSVAGSWATRTYTYSSKPAVSASTVYWICGVGDNDWGIKQDSGTSSGYGWWDDSNSYSSPTNPTDGVTLNTKVSMYADYTESGGAGSSSPSTSPSASPSVSPSTSPSVSPSSSVSASTSPSSSPSTSPSSSPSSSISASTSPSASPSVSPSISPSTSASVSPSISPSTSPSSSISASTSPSASPSISPSVSPSISPSSSASSSPSAGYQGYSRGNYVNLPTADTDLTTAYNEQDYLDVASSNDVRVAQGGSATQYILHQFKDYLGASTKCIFYLECQSNYAPSLSTVYLQIYNRNLEQWETLASNNSAAADTDFILSASVGDLTNYKDGNTIVACRVYQQA